jgi:hypothetical protein
MTQMDMLIIINIFNNYNKNTIIISSIFIVILFYKKGF